jgi:hypothetical protein
MGLADVSAEAFWAWWHGVVRVQATTALHAMGFREENCGVALEASDGSIELACELLVDAAEFEAEPATHGAANALRRRLPRHPAGDDHEPEPEITAPVGGSYYVGDADCSLAGPKSSRDDMGRWWWLFFPIAVLPLQLC